MAWLLWALGLLGLALLAVLLMPVRLRLLATLPRRVRLSAAALGGLVPEIPLYDSTRPRAVKEKAPRKAKKGGGDGAAGGRRLARAFARLIPELLGVFRFGHLRAEARYGLSDPADTGMLCGALAALTHSLEVRPGISLALRPDFDLPGVTGTLDAEVSVTPARLLPPAVRFAWRAWGPAR